MQVECCWLGSFVFKGHPGPVEMVAVSPSCLAGRSYPPDGPAGGKGLRVLQRVGMRERATLSLPAALERFWA